MAAAASYFGVLGLAFAGVVTSVAQRLPREQNGLAGAAVLVPMAASLKICWDLIFEFLKAELDRLECPDRHVAHTDWYATAGRLMVCDTALWRREPVGDTFIRAYELVVLEPKGWFWSQMLLVLVVPLCVLLHAGPPGLSRWERLSFCGVGFLGAISTAFAPALVVLAVAGKGGMEVKSAASAPDASQPTAPAAVLPVRSRPARAKSPARNPAARAANTSRAGAGRPQTKIAGAALRAANEREQWVERWRATGGSISPLLAATSLVALLCVAQLAPPLTCSRSAFIAALLALHLVLAIPAAEAPCLHQQHQRDGDKAQQTRPASLRVPAGAFLMFVGVVGSCIHLHALCKALPPFPAPPPQHELQALLHAFTSNSCQVLHRVMLT